MVSALSLWADNTGVNEPYRPDEALVFVSITYPHTQLLNFDHGPTTVYLLQTQPFLGKPVAMCKDDAFFYLGNLKVGRTYRIYSYVDETTRFDKKEISTFNQGIQGKDALTFKVEKTGLIYLGNFTHLDDKLLLLDKNHEPDLLVTLKNNLFMRNTWQTLIYDRLKELQK